MVGPLGPVFKGNGWSQRFCRAHERSFVMSKFMLSMGLVLASLAGFSSAGKVEAASSDQTVQSADQVRYDDTGPYESLQAAVAEGKARRAHDSYAYGVTAGDGSYYVPVARQYDATWPVETGRRL